MRLSQYSRALWQFFCDTGSMRGRILHRTSMRFADAKGPWLICVDDNEPALRLRAAVLELHGFRVSQFTNEHDALDFLSKHQIDGAVVDYLMPEIMGNEFASTVRRTHPELPIVLISGAIDDPEDLGGADVFVSKSAGSRRLVEVLRQIFSKMGDTAA